jgi:hypothetical protein
MPHQRGRIRGSVATHAIVFRPLAKARRGDMPREKILQGQGTGTAIAFEK